MDTPLTKFFATVGFKVDTSAWDSTIKKVRSDLTSLRTRTVTVKLKYVGGKTKLPQLTQKVKLLASNKLSLQNVRLTYVNKLKALKPALTQEVKLVYTNRLTTLPSIIQHVNLVYHNRQGGAGNAGGGGSPNPWHMAGGGGLLAGNNVRAFGATIGIAGAANQMYDTGNFQVGLQPQYEFLTGSAEGAKKQIAFVNKLANDLHINLRDVDTTYKQFLGATESSIGMEKSMKTFETIQKFGVMVGATPEALKRGTKAIQQMLSKQKLSAEELTGQLAEASLIPGSTQVFADVLEGTGERGSGSVKKLFANMKDGKYELQDIVRVLDSLQSRINQDQLEKMFDRPAAAMADLQNSMTRFWMAVNEEGGLDLQTTILGGLAKTLNDVTEWIKENKEEIGLWTTRLKIVASTLWDLAPALLAVYGAMKLIKLLRWAGVLGASTTALRPLLTTLISGGAITLQALARSLFGDRLVNMLMPDWALPPRPPVGFVQRLKNLWSMSFKAVRLALPVMIAALAWDLVDTLNGKATYLSAGAGSDNWLVRILSKSVIAAGEWVKTLGLTALSLYDFLMGNIDWAEFKTRMQDFWGAFGESAALSDELSSGAMDGFFARLDAYISWAIKSAGVLGQQFDSLFSGDFSKMWDTAKNYISYTKDMWEGTSGDLTGAQMMERNARRNLNFPTQPILPPTVQQSLPYRPRANNSSNSTVISPNVTLNVAATGTADEIAKIASQQFTDMFTSGILGTMANYQSGAK